MNARSAFGRLAADVSRALRNFKFELTGSGIYIPGAKQIIGGVFRHAHAPAGLVDRHGNPIFGPWSVDPNRMVDEGLIYTLNAAFGGGAQVSAWYIAPFAGNVAPAAGWTGANFRAQATEFVDYTQATRLPWTTAPAAGTPTIGNSAALAAATMTFAAGGPYNVYGLGLLQAQAKNAVTGVLGAATRFTNPRLNMAGGDQLASEYVITAADAS